MKINYISILVLLMSIGIYSDTCCLLTPEEQLHLTIQLNQVLTHMQQYTLLQNQTYATVVYMTKVAGIALKYDQINLIRVQDAVDRIKDERKL